MLLCKCITETGIKGIIFNVPSDERRLSVVAYVRTLLRLLANPVRVQQGIGTQEGTRPLLGPVLQLVTVEVVTGPPGNFWMHPAVG